MSKNRVAATSNSTEKKTHLHMSTQYDHLSICSILSGANTHRPHLGSFRTLSKNHRTSRSDTAPLTLFPSYFWIILSWPKLAVKQVDQSLYGSFSELYRPHPPAMVLPGEKHSDLTNKFDYPAGALDVFPIQTFSDR
jgi:hypothetical protein